MIKSFKHKGLEQFFLTGNKKGIKPGHARRIARILDRIHAANNIIDIDAPGYDLHFLEPKHRKIFSVKVSGNWRITFRFEDGDAEVVDYLDYH